MVKGEKRLQCGCPIRLRRRTSTGHEGTIMADINFDNPIGTVEAARSKARVANHVERAQLMLAVAGLAAFGIVAVAATMMTTLF